MVFSQKPGLALAERHGTPSATASLHLPHEINPNTDQEEYRKRTDEQLANQALRFRLLRREVDTIFFENADQRVVVGLGADGVVLQRRPTTVVDPLTIEFDPLNLARTNIR